MFDILTFNLVESQRIVIPTLALPVVELIEWEEISGKISAALR
jgi:hypothetical protein